MQRLAHLGQAQAVVGEQRDPARHRAEVPRRRVLEVVAEAGPASRAPAVDIGRLATGHHRVDGLHEQAATGPQIARRGGEQAIDRLLADQREVGDSDIDRQRQLAGADLFIRHCQELATAGGARPVDQARDRIHADHRHLGQRAHQPAFAATEIEAGARRTRPHRGDDGGIGHQLARFDLAAAHGRGPRLRVARPGFENCGVGMGGHERLL